MAGRSSSHQESPFLTPPWLSPSTQLLLTGENRSRYSKEKHTFGTLIGEVPSHRVIPGAFVEAPAEARFLPRCVSCAKMAALTQTCFQNVCLIPALGEPAGPLLEPPCNQFSRFWLIHFKGCLPYLLKLHSCLKNNLSLYMSSLKRGAYVLC